MVSVGLVLVNLYHGQRTLVVISVNHGQCELAVVSMSLLWSV